MRPEIVQAILLLGIVSYACRASGFFLMQYVAATPRVKAWLRSIPVALTGAIVAPLGFNGGPPEWLGFAATAILMRLTANEFLSAIGAVAVVALSRALLS
ncbi:MAG: AzlD domain-containing protein [Alphaproteobacteria bacterium]|nr:AzlD domain-containing protein [Alphaproteobacteria bacterium]